VERFQEEVNKVDLYVIFIEPEAQRGLLSIAVMNRRLIIDALDGLATDPRPPNSKLLVNAENLRRLTVGDYRVIYGIEQNLQKVTIELVRHRSKAYALLAALALSVRNRYSR
jgi:mRNA interferase RelE/StbE